MTIREYLEGIFEAGTFEEWDAEDSALWEAYEDEADDERFFRMCAERGIVVEGDEDFCYWVWDHEE